MVLTPTYYLADFQTGVLHGEALPLEDVSLTSNLQPGHFTASLDLRKIGSRADAWRVMDLLAHGKCTLAPVLEGISTGVGNPTTARVLGEWWISEVEDSPPSPIVRISGPEFEGYAADVIAATSWIYTSADPVVQLRRMLTALYSTSQDVEVDLQEWVSHTGARIPVDIRRRTTDYWSAIRDLQENEKGPFEWMIRTGLDFTGGVARRVTRTLEVGQPRLALNRPDITLELAAPGQVASIVSTTRTRSEHRTVSHIYGWGAGSGDDQYVGEASRAKVPGEPVKSRVVTDRSANSNGQVDRISRAALTRFTPQEHVWPATMPTDRYTPLVGEVYGWVMDPQWSRPGESTRVRCVGWSWRSNADVYELQLTEV